MTPDHPQMLPAVDLVQPVPRRVRATIGAATVLDTIRASYVWEWPGYPQFYVPIDDVSAELVDEGGAEETSRGTARRHGLRLGDVHRPDAAWVYGPDAIDGVAWRVRFDWAAADSWWEEDEEVFVHPRNPYTRVDALRSGRHVQVRLDGVLLAESTSPVAVFETGLPTRWYVDRSAVRWEHLVPTSTETQCPYKGRTTGWWSVVTATGVHPDLAWSYDFPTRQLLPVAGLVAFYNEKVDLTVDGVALERPQSPFS